MSDFGSSSHASAPGPSVAHFVDGVKVLEYKFVGIGNKIDSFVKLLSPASDASATLAAGQQNPPPAAEKEPALSLPDQGVYQKGTMKFSLSISSDHFIAKNLKII